MSHYKNHPWYNERKLQTFIYKHPTCLAIPDIKAIDKERIQTPECRIDLLMESMVTKHRYIVEVQLGKLDDDHVLRLQHYYANEKAHYPTYSYTAVLVVEEIKPAMKKKLAAISTFFPLLVIKLEAPSTSNTQDTPLFTHVSLAFEEKERKHETFFYESELETSWKKKLTAEQLQALELLLEWVNEMSPSAYRFSYQREYIGLEHKGCTTASVIFKPKSKGIKLRFPHIDMEDMKPLLKKREILCKDNQNKLIIAYEYLPSHEDYLKLLFHRALVK